MGLVGGQRVQLGEMVRVEKVSYPRLFRVVTLPRSRERKDSFYS